MSARMQVPLDYEFSNTAVATRPAIHCEMSDDPSDLIWLTVPHEDGTAESQVTLTSDEARAVAAILTHYAERAEARA